MVYRFQYTILLLYLFTYVKMGFMKYVGYGFIEFMNPSKLKHDGWDDQIEPELRKPTPEERREIILNFIRTHSDKPLDVYYLSYKLNVSKRTIQSDLRTLETRGLIIRTPRYNKHGQQLTNIYKFNGTALPLPPNAITLKKLYDPTNPCGIRDWDWEDFKFIPGYFDRNFTREMQISQNFELQELKERQRQNKEKK